MSFHEPYCKGKVSAFPFSVYSVNRFRKQEKSECTPEKRRSDITLYLTKNFNIIISFTNECAAAHLLEKDWRQLDGYTACYCEPYCFGCSGVYGLARKESSKGSVLLRMWRLRKELQAEDALSRPKEYIILGDTLIASYRAILFPSVWRCAEEILAKMQTPCNNDLLQGVLVV